MPLYAAHGVSWAWLVDPAARTLEAYVLEGGQRWSKPNVYEGPARVRAVPFDAVEIDLSALWAK
jgi:Uma2 family endonuclease